MAVLWVMATLIAAAAQTARNATQNHLTGLIGTAGATQVRFLYGWPFAFLFLALVLAVTGERLPAMTRESLLYVGLGALAQILATMLMLRAMQEKSFSVTTAYIKTEPITTALIGFVLLGDSLTLSKGIAILIATCGVLVMSIKPGEVRTLFAWGRPMLLGIAAGLLFGLAAVAFRGAIQGLETGSFLTRATTILAWSLGAQTLMLMLYLALFDRAALVKSFGVWRHSLLAGFLGAFASQFWFIGFSLTTAANVRTLALVEVLMAQIVSRRLFSQHVSRREIIGMGLIMLGVALLLRAAS